jgi:hypothetical protein
MSDYVTLGEYWDAPAAHLARMKIEAAGLECRLLDENVNVLRDISRQARAIRLQVPAADQAAAEEILAGEEDSALDDEELTRQAMEAGEEE